MGYGYLIQSSAAELSNAASPQLHPIMTMSHAQRMLGLVPNRLVRRPVHRIVLGAAKLVANRLAHVLRVVWLRFAGYFVAGACDAFLCLFQRRLGRVGLLGGGAG